MPKRAVKSEGPSSSGRPAKKKRRHSLLIKAPSHAARPPGSKVTEAEAEAKNPDPEQKSSHIEAGRGQKEGQNKVESDQMARKKDDRESENDGHKDRAPNDDKPLLPHEPHAQDTDDEEDNNGGGGDAAPNLKSDEYLVNVLDDQAISRLVVKELQALLSARNIYTKHKSKPLLMLELSH